MGSIVIKLQPSKLKNPDLDLRYLIPKEINELTNNRIIDDGYDYLDDEKKTLVIFLQSSNLREEAKEVLEILKTKIFLGNNLYETSTVAICENDNEDLNNYTSIHSQQA